MIHNIDFLSEFIALFTDKQVLFLPEVYATATRTSKSMIKSSIKNGEMDAYYFLGYFYLPLDREKV